MRKNVPESLSSGEVSLTVGQEGSIFVESTLGVGLDIDSSFSGSTELDKGFTS